MKNGEDSSEKRMVKATNQKAAPSRGSFNSTHLGHLQIKEKIIQQRYHRQKLLSESNSTE